MVKPDVAELRKLPPEDRVKVLVELERKRKAELRQQQKEAEEDVQVAEDMIKESLDEVAIQEELKRARSELKQRSRDAVEDVVQEKREEHGESVSLERSVANAPRTEQRRMYMDTREELERFSAAGPRPARGDLRQLYSALKSVEENIAEEVYGRGQDVSDLYHVPDQNISAVWQRVHEMPRDEFGYKDRMEAVLDHIYEMRKHSQDTYQRSDH